MKTIDKIELILKIKFILFLLIIFWGCSVSPRFRSEPVSVSGESLPKDVKVLSTEIGIASYYGKKYHGRATASGEIFDMYKISAAHKEHPFGTIARVTNLSNGKWIVLKINDRGPFIKGRIIDLSYSAAERLGFIREGTTKVKIEVLKWGQKKE